MRSYDEKIFRFESNNEKLIDAVILGNEAVDAAVIISFKEKNSNLEEIVPGFKKDGGFNMGFLTPTQTELLKMKAYGEIAESNDTIRLLKVRLEVEKKPRIKQQTRTNKSLMT